MAKSASSKRWLKEHFDDPYVIASKAAAIDRALCLSLKSCRQNIDSLSKG